MISDSQRLEIIRRTCVEMCAYHDADPGGWNDGAKAAYDAVVYLIEVLTSNDTIGDPSS